MKCPKGENMNDKEFWEWCGLYTKRHPSGNWDMWYAKDEFIGNIPPEFTLDNLFKYALKDYQQIIFQPEPESDRTYCGVFFNDEIYESNGETPALALRSAIEKVIESEMP